MSSKSKKRNKLVVPSQRYQTRSVQKAQIEAIRFYTPDIAPLLKNDINVIISKAASVRLVSDGINDLCTNSSVCDWKKAMLFLEAVRDKMNIAPDAYDLFLRVVGSRSGLESIAVLIEEHVECLLQSPSPHDSPSPCKKSKQSDDIGGQDTLYSARNSLTHNNKTAVNKANPLHNGHAHSDAATNGTNPPGNEHTSSDSPQNGPTQSDITVNLPNNGNASDMASNSPHDHDKSPAKLERQIPEDIELQHQKRLAHESKIFKDRIACLQSRYEKEVMIRELEKENSELLKTISTLKEEKSDLHTTISSLKESNREKDIQIEELQRKIGKSKARSNPESSKYLQQRLSIESGVLRVINKENCPPEQQ